MDYHYKSQQGRHKKRRRLKPLPIMILIIIITLLIAIVVFFAKTISDEKNGAQSNQSIASAEKKTSGMASENQAIAPPSSVMSNSDAPSSKNSSADLNEIISEPSSTDASESGETVSAPSSKATSEAGETVSSATAMGWNLILLNPKVAISKDLSFGKTKFDTQYVDSRAAPAYQAMYDAAKKDGITLYLRSGYRSMGTQRINYNSAVDRYLKQGKSKEEALELTNQYYTSPGHSEHHSGLAFDIITPEYHNTTHSLDDRFAQTEAYSWLIKNCTDYGFILRYPQDKKAITEINYEPWHYRYVGVEHAKAITKNGWCLEEYIEKLKSEYANTGGDPKDDVAYAAFAEAYAAKLL